MRAHPAAPAACRRFGQSSSQRIETLRLLNELMYAAASAEVLRMRPFLTQLVENLCHMHQDQGGEVRLEFAIEDVELTPETALPLGLILNEFVTNSLKYAFDGQGGVISVAIEHCQNGALRLQLRDNGKGLPSVSQTAERGSGTGMKLIQGFAEQIGANPVWASGDPGVFSLGKDD